MAIPNLPSSMQELLFSCHIEAIERTQKTDHHSPVLRQEDLHAILNAVQTGIKEIMALILKLGSSAISSVGKVLEHDPNNSHLPPIAEEMKKKILLLLNVVPKEDILAMPTPVLGCNCMYCQINRTLREGIGIHESDLEENRDQENDDTVDEKDLEFSEWNVTPISEKLFLVRNKLDEHEEYRVFLGNPIGCTCGKANCEHIVAVLRS